MRRRGDGFHLHDVILGAVAAFLVLNAAVTQTNINDCTDEISTATLYNQTPTAYCQYLIPVIGPRPKPAEFSVPRCDKFIQSVYTDNDEPFDVVSGRVNDVIVAVANHTKKSLLQAIGHMNDAIVTTVGHANDVRIGFVGPIYTIVTHRSVYTDNMLIGCHAVNVAHMHTNKSTDVEFTISFDVDVRGTLVDYTNTNTSNYTHPFNMSCVNISRVELYIFKFVNAHYDMVQYMNPLRSILVYNNKCKNVSDTTLELEFDSITGNGKHDRGAYLDYDMYVVVVRLSAVVVIRVLISGTPMQWYAWYF